MLGVLLATAACGGTSDSPMGDATVDADIPTFHCWPSLQPIPRGTAVLGHGFDAFRPMGDTLPLEYGSQDGFMVKVRTRMSGFLTGGPPITNPANPFTRVRAYFADTGQSLQLPSECGMRDWYVQGPSGEYELFRELAVVFDVCWRMDRLNGARIRIDLDLMDATGTFASDSKVITATEPVAPGYPIDTTPPTCGM